MNTDFFFFYIDSRLGLRKCKNNLIICMENMKYPEADNVAFLTYKPWSRLPSYIILSRQDSSTIYHTNKP